jgi:cytochrome c5
MLALGCTRAERAEPAGVAQLSPRLVLTYQSVCAECHARPGTGAPLAGDSGAWAKRRAQGADALLAHTVNGYRGMPPLGACGACSEAELRALVAYLSGSGGGAR